MAISAGKFWGLRRLADEQGRFKMVAIDQRPPIMNLICERQGVDEAAAADVAAVKRLLARELGPHASAVLADPRYAFPHVIDVLSPRQGIIHTLEHHAFEEGPGGRRSDVIPDWSVAKIRRAGGDGVKVLVWYRPDADDAVNRHQEDFVKRAAEACDRHDLPFILEMLLYPLEGDAVQTKDYVEQPNKRPELVLETVRRFAQPAFGVDLFKLESPIPAMDVPDPSGPDLSNDHEDDVRSTQRWFDEMGALTGRPWVMLSAGAGKEAFRHVLTYAYRAGASGFLAGRAIWWQAFQQYPDLDAMRRELQADGIGYMDELGTLTDEMAAPWHRHRSYGDGPVLKGAGDDWATTYGDGKTG